MHSGFAVLREALPMNLRIFRPRFAVWSAVQADIDRITEIWRECLGTWKGPWLFGAKPTIADAMYAPVVTRFRSYDVKMDKVCESLLPADHGLAGHEGMVRRRPARAGTDRRARYRVLVAASEWPSRRGGSLVYRYRPAVTPASDRLTKVRVVSAR